MPDPSEPSPERLEATVSWHDPAQVLPRLVALDGLAYVRAVRDGELPPDPLMEALGIRVVEAEPGRVVMTAEPAGQHLNLGGIVHGGFLSTLMDCATGFALHTTVAPGSTTPHVAAGYQYLRSGRAGVALRCTGEVLRAGGRLGHVRAEVRDADDRLLATGETTHAIVDTTGGGTLRAGPSA
jgi:acyl-CoA thioesterase